VLLLGRWSEHMANLVLNLGSGPGAAQPATRALVGRSVAEVERSLILHTLDYCLGNRTHTARMLGISIRTLRNKLSQYTIVDPALHGHPSTHKQGREITGSTPSQARRARGKVRFERPCE